MFDLFAGHVSVGFSRGGPLYGLHPKTESPEFNQERAGYSIQKVEAFIRAVEGGKHPCIVLNTDANIYSTVSIAHGMGYDTEVFCRAVELPSTVVDAAERLAKRLSGSAPGDSSWPEEFPVRYGWRHRDGTFEGGTSDCINFLACLNLLQPGDTPPHMKALVADWTPLSERLDFSSGASFLDLRVLIGKIEQSMAPGAHSRTCTNAEYLCSEGQVNKQLFLMRSGACSIEQGWKPIGVACAGNCFGELGFINIEQTHNAHCSIKAIGEVECLHFEADDVVACAKESPEFAFYFILLLRILKPNSTRLHLGKEEELDVAEAFDEFISELEPLAGSQKAHL